MVDNLGILWRKFMGRLTGWERIGKAQVPPKVRRKSFIDPNLEEFHYYNQHYKVNVEPGYHQGHLIRTWFRLFRRSPKIYR